MCVEKPLVTTRVRQDGWRPGIHVHQPGDPGKEEFETMVNGKNEGSRHARWAHLRFSIIGPLLAAPPARGDLACELKRLASKPWRHPITGAPVQFGFSTLERWLYAACLRCQQGHGFGFMISLSGRIPSRQGGAPTEMDLNPPIESGYCRSAFPSLRFQRRAGVHGISPLFFLSGTFPICPYHHAQNSILGPGVQVVQGAGGKQAGVANTGATFSRPSS